MSAADLINRDLDKLHPVFRERVEELLRRLRELGFDPIVWEGWRSFERAEMLQRRGTGVVKSMHCYGLAVDILDRFHRWNAPPAFWSALGSEAKVLGLEWGGDWKRADRPHVQVFDSSLDDWVRLASDAELAERVERALEATDPARRSTVRESVRAKAKP